MVDRAADPGADAASTSRRDLVRRATVAAAGASIAGAAVFGPRATVANAAPPSQVQDRQIFNFALLLEYVQAAFYSEAVRQAALKGEVREFAEVVAEHEREHVAFLQHALGAHARPRPRLEFRQATRDERTFVQKAVLLENTGVVAYNGQAANLTKPALAAAAEIVSVEGRHAAWISDLAGEAPAPRAADVGASSADVVRALQSTGFLKTK
jgi:rubrerythrin